MKPTLVIVGRPNVGKSTLFNRLTRSRDALVADQPGLTRDRNYGHGRVGPRAYLVVDTGGFEPNAREAVEAEMVQQAEMAIAEADVLLFVVDGRSGLSPQDRTIAGILRRTGRPVVLVVNKAEGLDPDQAAAEFHELACGKPVVVSAAHGGGIADLVEVATGFFPESEDETDHEESLSPMIAVVGRPNAGKSTLINTLLGEERVIVLDQPGTTRDAILIPFCRQGRNYSLIDTAGLRRKGKVFETIEKFSVIKTLQAIEKADVAILMLDATRDISDQDAHIAGFCLEAGRSIVVAVNKWDAVDEYQRERIKSGIERKLNFLRFANVHYISALKGKGIRSLFASVDSAYAGAMIRMATPKLTRLLQSAVEKQAPPRHGIFRPKLRYAHQGGNNPPVIVIHGNALEHLSDGYLRYLERTFAEAFKLKGTPLKIELRTTRNPYAGKHR